METIEAKAEPRLASLASRVDCFTEEDLCLLTDATPSTLKSWRKRGEGPAYYMAGNRALYPRKAVTDWMETRLRDRKPLNAKGVL